MAETLSTLSVISFVIAGVCLGIVIFLWFFLKIPHVIGSLSGRTARKSIAKMREANEKNGAFVYRSVSINAKPVIMPQNASPMVEHEEVESVEDELRPETGLLTNNENVVVQMEGTTLLNEEAETVPLDSAEHADVRTIERKKFIILDEVMLIHTEERIEC